MDVIHGVLFKLNLKIWESFGEKMAMYRLAHSIETYRNMTSVSLCHFTKFLQPYLLSTPPPPFPFLSITGSCKIVFVVMLVGSNSYCIFFVIFTVLWRKLCKNVKMFRGKQQQRAASIDWQADRQLLRRVEVLRWILFAENSWIWMMGEKNPQTKEPFTEGRHYLKRSDLQTLFM